jgi:CheY-like chemotaxis protein
LLGGDIEVHSELGRGSTFGLKIATGPLGGVRMLTGDLATRKRVELPNELPPDALTGVHILLAEDGPDNQRLIQMVLRRTGAEVTTVENGEQALDLLLLAESEGAPFDLLLTDMRMPVMDGYELARNLRLRGNKMPIVALTANAMEGDRDLCLAAGCDDYVSKPVDKWQLLQSLQKWIRRSAAAVR